MYDPALSAEARPFFSSPPPPLCVLRVFSSAHYPCSKCLISQFLESSRILDGRDCSATLFTDSVWRLVGGVSRRLQSYSDGRVCDFVSRIFAPFPSLMKPRSLQEIDSEMFRGTVLGFDRRTSTGETPVLGFGNAQRVWRLAGWRNAKAIDSNPFHYSCGAGRVEPPSSSLATQNMRFRQ